MSPGLKLCGVGFLLLAARAQQFHYYLGKSLREKIRKGYRILHEGLLFNVFMHLLIINLAPPLCLPGC